MLLTAIVLALGSLGPARRFVPEPYAQVGAIVCANGLRIDATAALASTDRIATGTVIVAALRRPVDSTALEALRAAGLEPLAGVFPQSVVCRAGRDIPATTPDCALWLAPLPPGAKLAPDLPADGLVEAVAALWPGTDPQTVAGAIAASGAKVSQVGAHTLEFSCPADRLIALAALDAVAWVQPRPAAEPFNSAVQWVLQRGWLAEAPPPATATPIYDRGIRGQGITVGLFDSGIYTAHDMFRDERIPIIAPGIFPTHRKVVAYKMYRTAHFGDNNFFSYHGSAVAGSLCGSDSAAGGASKYDGFAPDSRVCFVDNGTTYGTYVFDADLTELLDSVRLGRGLDERVRQASGSFGSGTALGYYRIEEATVDAALWNDKWFTLVWAAGNFGRGTYNIGHPACAKSALTVGACGNGTAAREVPDFTSRGPTRDERTKPDLVSPGRTVFTVYGDSACNYRSRNGTSFSAPGVSAALALVRQYLRDGWHPSGRPEPQHAWPRVTSALLRGLALAAADPDVGTEFVPNKDVGWGRLDLGRLLHFEGDSIELDLFEDTVGLSTGEFREHSFERVGRQPLRVALVWTDTAAPPFPLAALVNDINLELVSPDGNRYRGNALIDGQSAPNPPLWDTRNTAELCLLDLPLPGRWTARVYGRNVYSPRQPYALVVRTGPTPPAAVAEAPAAPLPRLSAARIGPRLPVLGPGRLTAFSSDGRAVASERIGPGRHEWPGTRRLPAGVYAVRFEPAGRPPEICRLVVVR
ncbi:MAG: S8 family serine peptidase [bacterium]